MLVAPLPVLRILFGFVALTALGVGAVAQAAKASEQPWSLIDEDDGVKVYRRDLPGTGLYEFRGVGVVDAGIPKIVALLSEAGKMPQWIDGCVRGELLEKSFADNDFNRKNSEYYEVAYGENSAPWPLQNRDYILKSSVNFVPKSSLRAAHVNVHSETVKNAQRPPLDDLVRIQLMRTNIDLTPMDAPNTKTEVDFSVVMDPGGVLPDAIINLVTRTLPLKTVQALSQLVKTEDYNRALERLVAYHYAKNQQTNPEPAAAAPVAPRLAH